MDYRKTVPKHSALLLNTWRLTVLLDILKGIALSTVAVLCLSLTYESVSVGKHASQTLMSVNGAVSKLNGKNANGTI